MSFKEIWKCISRKSDFKKEINAIVKKLPSNEEVAKEVLTSFENHHTKVKFDADIKNSYYVFLNDTIYISDNRKDQNEYSRITLIVHEVIHSLQNKFLQWINFLASNIEILLFLVCCICTIIGKSFQILYFSYIGVFILTILARAILELHAVIKSIFDTEKYLTHKLKKEDLKKVMKGVKTNIIVLLPVFLISLFFWKFVRFAIVFYMYI